MKNIGRVESNKGYIQIFVRSDELPHIRSHCGDSNTVEFTHLQILGNY